MSRYLGILAVATLAVAAGCSPGDASAEASRPRPPRHELGLDLGGERELLAYAWNGGPRVPAARVSGPVRIEYGEVGVTEDTRLYLHMNEAGGTPADGSADARTVVHSGAAWTEGRHGAGLALSDGSGLRVLPGDRPLLEGRGTLELLVRPQPGALGRRGELLRLPGVLGLTVDGKGFAVLEVQTDPPARLRAKAALAEGEWSRVAVVVDGPELRVARLVVDDTAARVPLPDGLPAAAAELQLGGIACAVDELRVRALPTPTAELIEDRAPRATAGAHRLALTYADGTEEVELWAGTLTDPVLASPEQWVQGELTRAVGDADGLRWVPGAWERIHADGRPLARTTHPTVYVGDGRVFMYGGETRDTHVAPMVNTDDTWLFHTREGRWERVHTEEAPPPSCHQPAAWSPDHRAVLYAGGWRNDEHGPVEYDQTWLFFPDEGRWERRAPKGIEFPRTSNGGLVYYPPRRGFLFFRAGTMRVMGYMPDNDRWNMRPKATAVDLAGEPVDYRPGGSFMVGHDPESDRILVYGGGLGYGETDYQDTTAWYDPDTNVFTVIEPRQAPAPRVRSGFAYDSKRRRFVLFGGVRGQFSQRMDDLWVFDPATEQWEPREASNTPPRRGGFYGMAYDPDVDRFFLLCGRHAPERFLDEAWSLSLDETAAGEARYVFDRAAFPGHDRWFARWRAPEGAEVALRFRGSADAVDWSDWGTAEEVVEGGARFVQVALTLRPGPGGGAPAVLSMGFAPAARVPVDDGDDGVQRSVLSVEPFR